MQGVHSCYNKSEIVTCHLRTILDTNLAHLAFSIQRFENEIEISKLKEVPETFISGKELITLHAYRLAMVARNQDLSMVYINLYKFGQFSTT